MRSRLLAAALTLGLCLGSAHAADQFAIPYKPSGAVAALMEATTVWGEVYPVPAAEVSAALDRAYQGQSPSSQAVAVVVDSTLHFAVGRMSQQLPETDSRMERDGQQLMYDERCGVSPRNGDRLVATYGATGNALSAELDVRVVKYLPFSNESDEPLDLNQPGACEQETHSRMFLTGTLRLKHDGALEQEVPVLLQTIVEPR